MPGLETQRGLRGEALPGYLGPCCPSPCHHHSNAEVSLQYLPRHLDLPHLGKEAGGSNPPQLWAIEMHRFPPVAPKERR